MPIFAKRIVRAFTLTGSEQLLGGFWFLISLFWSSIISLGYLSFLNRHNKVTSTYLWEGVLLLLLIASLINRLPVRLPQMFREQTILATALYLSGYLFKRMKIDFKGYYACLLIIPAISAFFLQLDMHTDGWRVFAIYSISMCGTLGIVSLSSILSKWKLASTLSYVGCNTLYILVFHFLAFKGVSAIYLFANELPIEKLSHFSVLPEVPSYMWLIYSVVGIIVPLIITSVPKRANT